VRIRSVSTCVRPSPMRRSPRSRSRQNYFRQAAMHCDEEHVESSSNRASSSRHARNSITCSMIRCYQPQPARAGTGGSLHRTAGASAPTSRTGPVDSAPVAHPPSLPPNLPKPPKTPGDQRAYPGTPPQKHPITAGQQSLSLAPPRQGPVVISGLDSLAAALQRACSNRVRSSVRGCPATLIRRVFAGQGRA